MTYGRSQTIAPEPAVMIEDSPGLPKLPDGVGFQPQALDTPQFAPAPPKPSRQRRSTAKKTTATKSRRQKAVIGYS